jgi:hypothetical protein
MRGKIAFLTGAVLTSFLLYPGISEGVISQTKQEDISSKVNNIYSRVLKGDKCSNAQGYTYEIDVPKYNLGAKENNEFITIYVKEKGNRQGFFDKDADGTPEMYIDILVFPNTPNATIITNEVIELFNSTESKKDTKNGKYVRVTDNNRAEIQAKYEKLVDEVIKDGI